jgi:hypothetical protein
MPPQQEIYNAIPKSEVPMPSMVDEETKNALESQKQGALLGAIMQGASSIASGIAGVKSDPSYGSQAVALGNLPLEQLKTKRDEEKRFLTLNYEKERNDVNSKSSQIARDAMKGFLNKIGYKTLADQIGNNLSARQIEDRFGSVNVNNLLSQYENAQARKEAMAVKAEQTQLLREDKLAQQENKKLIALKDDLDPNKARAGNLAKSQSMLNSSDRIDALFKQFPDYNIPKAQTVELATTIAALVSGGNPQSQHQINLLTPQSLRGNAQATAAWLTNKPLGQGQQQFMKLMHETALRERDVAATQVKKAQVQRLAAHQQIKQQNPEAYEQVLRAYDIDPNAIKDGKYLPSEPSNDRIEKGINAFMNKYPNLTRDEAVSILKKAGKM